MFPEFVQVFVVGLLIFLPVSLIYKKAGFHPAWAALAFLPGFGLLLIFMQLALLPWPNLSTKIERRS
jgi:uncharacterized membrane protein YhhN